jgi:hypothetical protein
MRPADGMGNDTRDGGYLEDVEFRHLWKRKKGALGSLLRASFRLLQLMKGKNLKALRQPGCAAINEYDRGDDQGRGEKHIERDGFTGQEPAQQNGN